VTELGDSIIQKLITAGITTVEGLADMTPEQLEEIPGIGEKTLEKIGVAVRNYFSRFEEAEPAQAAEAAAAADAEAVAEAAQAAETAVDAASEAEAVDAEAAAEAEAEETALPEVVLTEGSLDDAQPPVRGKETIENAGEEAEAENSAEVIEEAEGVAEAETEEGGE
jgi:transcription termination/antitermination protein NusA